MVVWYGSYLFGAKKRLALYKITSIYALQLQGGTENRLHADQEKNILSP